MQHFVKTRRDARVHSRSSTWQANRKTWKPRRLHRSLLLRVAILLILIYTVFDAYAAHNAYARRRQPDVGDGINQERYFIASIHWNNEAILRSHWNQAVLDLVSHLGRNNTYISILESGSWDESKDALRSLDKKLELGDFRRKVVLDDTTHLDEISKTPEATGWIDTPRGKKELRRIPYLSRLRNTVLEPLAELRALGEKFDKIIFLNDVIFTVRDIEVLANTRGGDYAAVCSMDYSKPPDFYDTFALRDAQGYNKLMKKWPYFRAAASRSAIKRNEAVPVTSCWNGITIMDAAPFYDARAPLRFRGLPDSLADYHVEASECCLIHVDNPLSISRGVWVNPDVRVGYNEEAYRAVNPESTSWLSYWNIYLSLWENRILRWTTTNYFRDGIVARRFKTWRHADKLNKEAGIHCAVNEMQVLIENGWKHL